MMNSEEIKTKTIDPDFPFYNENLQHVLLDAIPFVMAMAGVFEKFQ